RDHPPRPFRAAGVSGGGLAQIERPRIIEGTAGGQREGTIAALGLVIRAARAVLVDTIARKIIGSRVDARIAIGAIPLGPGVAVAVVVNRVLVANRCRLPRPRGADAD